jgi:hypothetical protein
LSDAEARALVERAREVRSDAEDICALLDEAVEAYRAGNLVAVLDALSSARDAEREHGDDPATRALREQMIEEEHHHVLD